MQITMMVGIFTVITILVLVLMVRAFYTSTSKLVGEKAALSRDLEAAKSAYNAVSSELQTAKLSVDGYKLALRESEEERNNLIASIDAVKRSMEEERGRTQAFLRSLDGMDPEALARAIAERMV